MRPTCAVPGVEADRRAGRVGQTQLETPVPADATTADDVTAGDLHAGISLPTRRQHCEQSHYLQLSFRVESMSTVMGMYLNMYRMSLYITLYMPYISYGRPIRYSNGFSNGIPLGCARNVWCVTLTPQCGLVEQWQ